MLSDTSARYFIDTNHLTQAPSSYSLAKCLTWSKMIHRFTEDAENVITRLEDEKTAPEEEHDKQVMKTKS